MESKNITWPTDMNGVELDFGDTLYDTALKDVFNIKHFELHSGLNGPQWYANDGENCSVNLNLCYKIENDIINQFSQIKDIDNPEEIKNFLKSKGFNRIDSYGTKNGKFDYAIAYSTFDKDLLIRIQLEGRE